MEQIITGIVENHPGVLANIAQKFKEINVNISSVNVAETDDEQFSYITLVIQATEADIERIKQNLSTIIQIHKLDILGTGDHYEKELIMVQVSLTANQISQLTQIAELFRAHVVGVGRTSMTLEFVGESEQVSGFINMLKPFGILGTARTGRTALKKDA